jgi:hypothetical protein
VLLAFVEGISYYLSRSAALIFFFREIFDSDILEEFGESFDGIVLILPIVSLIFSSVKRRVVRGGVVSHTIGHELQKIGFLML